MGHYEHIYVMLGVVFVWAIFEVFMVQRKKRMEAGLPNTLRMYIDIDREILELRGELSEVMTWDEETSFVSDVLASVKAGDEIQIKIASLAKAAFKHVRTIHRLIPVDGRRVFVLEQRIHKVK